jgi:uncharacterized pyridoxal phosphate-containing UPF0001 family protein
LLGSRQKVRLKSETYVARKAKKAKRAENIHYKSRGNVQKNKLNHVQKKTNAMQTLVAKLQGLGR